MSSIMEYATNQLFFRQNPLVPLIKKLVVQGKLITTEEAVRIRETPIESFTI